MSDKPNQKDIQGIRSDRLSRLSEASLRISESLDLDTVLQEVVDGSRLLTGASRGGITVIDESGQLQHFITFGMTEEDRQWLLDLEGGTVLFAYLSSLPGPLRVSDFSAYSATLGLPGIDPPLGPVGSFLCTAIRLRGAHVGNLYLSDKQDGEEFTQEDEETLVMFASQAAMVIANARRHRDEQKARADLETLVNTCPVGVVVFDAMTGAPLSFNQEARRIVADLLDPGQPPERLLEVVSFKRADGREVSLDEFPLAQALSTGETVRAEEIVIQVPDGRSITTLVNATPVRSEEGEVETVIITLQDMTPLEELDRLRAEFLGMVSHELRLPLTSIKGSVTALLKTGADLDPAEMRQFHRIIDQQADTMQELIGELLDVARIETGTLHVSPEPAEVAVLVDRARSAFQSGGRHNLDIDLEPDLPLVMADRRRIVQVLGNLLSNAARHSPEWSAIRVSAAREGLHVAISVADQGSGIAGDHLPHLFEKASPAGEGGGHLTVGRGLGLSICKGIVEAHGGRITAESDGPGRGAKFTFTVPVADETAAEPSRPSPRSRRSEREQARVLIVDDDPQTLRYVRDTLTEAGYEPTVTADPEEALVLMEKVRPSLVLLDMMLPGADGIELMRDILSVADVPVIFLSVYDQDQVLARAFEQGASDYVVKPFSPTELVARVRAAIRRLVLPYRAEPAEPYILGDLRIDYGERRVTVAGRPVELTPTEYDLLVELSISGGRVVPHDHLLQRVWGPQKSGGMRTLRTHLARLRRKLGEDASSPRYIFIEPRVGYRMPKGRVPKSASA